VVGAECEGEVEKGGRVWGGGCERERVMPMMQARRHRVRSLR
jgi:hypothetical protein